MGATKRIKHVCHWPGCKIEVQPAMWGCRQHWFRLPKGLRDAIWAAYRRGQEIDKRPSAEYITVVEEVRAWIIDHYKPDVDEKPQDTR